MYSLVWNIDESYEEFIGKIENLIHINLITKYTLQLFDDDVDEYLDLDEEYFDKMRQGLLSSLSSSPASPTSSTYEISFKIIKNTISANFQSIEPEHTVKENFSKNDQDNLTTEQQLQGYIIDLTAKRSIEGGRPQLQNVLARKLENDDEVSLEQEHGMEPIEYFEITENCIEGSNIQPVEVIKEQEIDDDEREDHVDTGMNLSELCSDICWRKLIRLVQ
ncbi:unnamed protein product [Didymodactylos carnosus]|uniref:Uncharacterized protein n=1 Tax=Didymodactylos carnosus TaxID=1234261 RepID=A0A815PTR9_9BILA|nr:unnamed protein product [Didymodactylos carnosus]CAF4326835.1 unnamed protein product [Didymodactylos carnosus]